MKGNKQTELSVEGLEAAYAAVFPLYKVSKAITDVDKEAFQRVISAFLPFHESKLREEIATLKLTLAVMNHESVEAIMPEARAILSEQYDRGYKLGEVITRLQMRKQQGEATNGK